VVKRPSARLIVISPQGRALLFKFQFPDRIFWAAPGGALDPGETFRIAAERELFEETGLTLSAGSEVHVRHAAFKGPDGKWVEAEERYFAVHTDSEDIDRSNWTHLENDVMKAHAWLTPQDIRDCVEPVFPEEFAELLERLLNAKGA
jgi:8-oxo-dGTP pyrophosphatase MutT (NUDIX family)